MAVSKIKRSGMTILGMQQVSLTNSSVPAGSTGTATGVGVPVPGASEYQGLFMNSGYYPCIPQGAITATDDGTNLNVSCTLRNLHTSEVNIGIRALIIAVG